MWGEIYPFFPLRSMTPGEVRHFFSTAPNCPDVHVTIHRSVGTGTFVINVDGLAAIDLSHISSFATWVMYRLDCTILPSVDVSSDEGSLSLVVTAYSSWLFRSDELEASPTMVSRSLFIITILLVLLFYSLYLYVVSQFELNPYSFLAMWTGVPTMIPGILRFIPPMSTM
jgi:hypothetical protein